MIADLLEEPGRKKTQVPLSKTNYRTIDKNVLSLWSWRIISKQMMQVQQNCNDEAKLQLSAAVFNCLVICGLVYYKDAMRIVNMWLVDELVTYCH